MLIEHRNVSAWFPEEFREKNIKYKTWKFSIWKGKIKITREIQEMNSKIVREG